MLEFFFSLISGGQQRQIHDESNLLLWAFNENTLRYSDRGIINDFWEEEKSAQLSL